MDGLKIANEIKTKGFAVAKGDMNDESPSEWEVFGVWFYFRKDFYFDLDWRIGKYYFYTEDGREAIKAKKPKNKSLDAYTAESFLKDNLLKYFDKFSDIANIINKEGFFATDDTSLMEIMEDEDNRAVLYWIMSEPEDYGTLGFVNKKIPLMYISTCPNQEVMFNDAKKRGFKTFKEKFFEDDDDDEAIEKLEGFDELNFMF